jgi:hypothetical protein
LPNLLGELAQLLAELAQILAELAQILGELAQSVGKLAQSEAAVHKKGRTRGLIIRPAMKTLAALMLDRLPKDVLVIRGGPRPLSMMQGIDGTYDSTASRCPRPGSTPPSPGTSAYRS